MRSKKHRDGPDAEAALKHADRIMAALGEPFSVLDKDLRVTVHGEQHLTQYPE